ncbi:MAG: sensor histidine kinase, partial [Myxococcales bacterium]|nr:sensor histidine kinase [Myxococcales bacterium]
GLVAIHVHDTGRGISPTALSSAFDRFVKLDDTPDRSAGGTGLGLAISRELARLMNGDLTARSELDRGSTFTILLPKYDRRRHSLAEAPRELH